jgi:PAS domain S-box-containing protein
LAELDLARVYSITGESDGTLWIGSEKGLYRYADGALTNFYRHDQRNHREQQLAENPDIVLPGLAHNWVNAVAIDPAGGIWAATDRALYHGLDGKFRAYTKAQGLPGNDFHTVICTRNGEIWASAPPYGVVRRHEGRWTTYRHGEALSSSKAVDIFEDADGAIWVTTEDGGLNRFENGRWRTFDTSHGLADNTICGIADDNLGFLWVAYPHGVMRIPRQEFAEIDAGLRKTVRPQIFNQADGLPRGEVSPAGKPSAIRTRDGRLLFATDLGAAIIDPANVTLNQSKPPIHIERLSIDGADADLSRPVTVPPGRNDVQIHYTAISLPAPEKVQFKIRLAPLDRDWVDSGSLRDVRYAQLPPGNYTFHVKACNNDGVWDHEGASLEFKVRPFFYQTWWFIPLVVLSAIAAALALIWNRSRQAARQMAILAGLVDERTRELQTAKEGAEAAVLAKNDSIIALKQAQEQIAAERARFKFIFEAVPVGISLMQQGSDLVSLVNPAHKRITGISLEDLQEPDILERATHPEDLARQAPIVQQYRDGEIDHFTLEKRYVHRDGKIVWTALTRRMFSDPLTGAKQSITTLIDVTERKEAEAKLNETHKQLLGVSRQAGMAEVATEVLHNVGNVLNSVNVSATLVSDRMRESKVEYVRKLAVLLEEQAANLGAFFTEDRRGRQIPGYIMTLSDALMEEQKSIIEELADLRKNVEHIKEIVAMQQNFAKVSGVNEAVPITELVEDALRMNSSSLARHGFSIVREYVDQPVATTERHKVIQVLINLIRNAEQACESSDRPDKQVKLRITSDAGRARVAIIDNGVGIPLENLTRIFAHGFTTRQDGHGFGLHSGALVAKELGGALLAHSDGPGSGAIFTLELPLQREPLSRN